jgi:ABC-type multidrug transport system ATPase subunit
MGPSGSGKTSLLNCLAHKNSSYTGQILLNGKPASANTVARFSGFVQQVPLTPYTTCTTCITYITNHLLKVYSTAYLGVCFLPTLQEDLFIPTLTPREHLQFASIMRMDRSISSEAKQARVEGLIKDLGLTKCADTLIGGQGSSIRGDSPVQAKHIFKVQSLQLGTANYSRKVTVLMLWCMQVHSHAAKSLV